MSIEFENTLITEFSKLDFNNFSVDLSQHHLFLCGGEVDAKASIPLSFRDRLVTYSASSEPDIHNAIVLAEKFKDYFKDNAFTDLLAFEEEIANISTLVIIFLESPGSLVELGMFCSKPDFYKKLIIVVPEEEIESEDSFIYLGPLEYIRKKDPTSVVTYPWPKPDDDNYDIGNVIDLCDVINTKIKLFHKKEKFKQDHSGHVALLICEIVALSYPVLISDIELVLASMDINISKQTVSRHLYLLMKIGLVKQLHYSNYQYYYPSSEQHNKIKFGHSKTKHVIDIPKIRMSIRKSFILSDNSLAKKRGNALKQIKKKMEGDA